MSIENVKKFMDLARTKESLAKRMVALKDGLQEGEFHFKNDKEFVEKKILPLAKEYGIEFSVEDFMEFTSSQLTSLSEDELSEVSGGFPGIGLLIGLTVFLGGAATPKIASKAVSYFTGGGTSTVQSIAGKNADKAPSGETEQTAESQEQREIVKKFKNFVNQKEKELKTKLNDGAYMSPDARTAKINEIVKSLSGTTSDGQTITAVYNEKNDDITFESDKTSHKERLFETIRTPLYTAQSTNLAQLYQEAFTADYFKLKGECDKYVQNLAELKSKRNLMTTEYNEAKKSQNLKTQEHSVKKQQLNEHTNSSSQIWNRINYLINNLQLSGAIDINSDFLSIKKQYQNAGCYWDSSRQRYRYHYETQIAQCDQIITLKNQLTTIQQRISDLQPEVDRLNNELEQIQKLEENYFALNTQITAIENKINEINNRLSLTYDAKQTAFSNHMKNEYLYFYSKLLEELKKDAKITQLAEAAKTADDKIKLANKIKEKADNIIKEKLNAQLLNGCKIDFIQTSLMFDIKVHYSNQGWFSTFSVDEFISTNNHLEIITAEGTRKRDEVAKKLAGYVQQNFLKTTDDSKDLKRTIQSVLTDLKEGRLNKLDLGIQNVNVTENQVKFSLASGSEKRDIVLTIERIANEYDKMVNMQAMEAIKQQKEGTIAYTPFDRTLFNSIGSQARHVLDTLDKIQDLSDVKDRKAFENDLNYVAHRILTQGDTPFGLRGDYHTDKSIKAKDLKKIKAFEDKIKKLQ